MRRANEENWQTPQENSAFAAMRRAKERAEQELGTLKAERESWQAQQEELKALRTARDRATVEKDIAAIKQVYPDFAATGMDDLPQDFVHIMATGRVDALTAYEILHAQKNRNTPTPPPAPGAVNNDGHGAQEFYSPAQVDALTDKDFKKDPGLLKRIQKSMTKWR